MATLCEYLCNDCGLQAMISPQDSAINAGAIRTGYCVHCESFHAPVIEAGEVRLPRALDARQRLRFVCDTHLNTPLVPWFRHMPCPRCNGKFGPMHDGMRVCAD